MTRRPATCASVFICGFKFFLLVVVTRNGLRQREVFKRR
jgi:hypothetical protein